MPRLARSVCPTRAKLWSSPYTDAAPTGEGCDDAEAGTKAVATAAAVSAKAPARPRVATWVVNRRMQGISTPGRSLLPPHRGCDAVAVFARSAGSPRLLGRFTQIRSRSRRRVRGPHQRRTAHRVRQGGRPAHPAGRQGPGRALRPRHRPAAHLLAEP